MLHNYYLTIQSPYHAGKSSHGFHQKKSELCNNFQYQNFRSKNGRLGTPLPVEKKAEKYTYKDLCSWPENERWELIDGVAYDMTPPPSTRHQGILSELHFIVRNFLEGKNCKVYFAPFGVLLPKGDEPDDEIDTVVEPDLVAICDKSKIEKKGCRGAPDWVVEIISPSTRKKDLLRKTILYESRGVKEYWVIYPDEKMIIVFELEGKKEYVQKRIYIGQAKAHVAVLPGLEIDLLKIFQE
ncbi:MAG: Uma2 family endonuclease [Candidatus Riflebacteria bacterium]|nr:Uma2 family endonuclease [Candidatus Riflebacteria bacterium]